MIHLSLYKYHFLLKLCLNFYMETLQLHYIVGGCDLAAEFSHCSIRRTSKQTTKCFCVPFFTILRCTDQWEASCPMYSNARCIFVFIISFLNYLLLVPSLKCACSRVQLVTWYCLDKSQFNCNNRLIRSVLTLRKMHERRTVWIDQ